MSQKPGFGGLTHNPMSAWAWRRRGLLKIIMSQKPRFGGLTLAKWAMNPHYFFICAI